MILTTEKIIETVAVIIAKTKEKAAYYKENESAAEFLEIKELIANLIPTVAQMEETLGNLGGAIRPSHVDIPREMFYNSVCVAKEVRDRYTILQLLWDLGLEKEFAEELSNYFYA